MITHSDKLVRLEEFTTESLQVFLHRPNPYHQNWGLCFIGTNQRQVMAWNDAIEAVAKERHITVFHQGAWGEDHRVKDSDCINHPYDCVGTVHYWEIWTGCTEIAIEFNHEPIEVIRACGEPQLEALIDEETGLFPAIRQFAEKIL